MVVPPWPMLPKLFCKLPFFWDDPFQSSFHCTKGFPPLHWSRNGKFPCGAPGLGWSFRFWPRTAIFFSLSHTRVVFSFVLPDRCGVFGGNFPATWTLCTNKWSPYLEPGLCRWADPELVRERAAANLLWGFLANLRGSFRSSRGLLCWCWAHLETRCVPVLWTIRCEWFHPGLAIKQCSKIDFKVKIVGILCSF